MRIFCIPTLCLCIVLGVLTIQPGSAAFSHALVISNGGETGPRVGDFISEGEIVEGTASGLVLLMGDKLHRLGDGERLEVIAFETAFDLDSLSSALREARTVWVEGGPKILRGAKSEIPPEPWIIDATVDATHCLSKDKSAVLWRPPQSSRAQVILSTRSTGEDLFFTWAANTERVDWPDNVKIDDGAVFDLSIDKRRRRLTIHQIASTGIAALFELHDVGCMYQLYRIGIAGNSLE